jgi:REP element-mobilizing transposase RayT
MSERYKIIDSSIPTFITITVVDWIDLFIRRPYVQVINESLNFCINNKGLRIHAYVFMTSHIHLIVSSEKEELQNIIRDFKKHTSKK